MTRVKSTEKNMQINPDIDTSAYTIKSYTEGEIIIYDPVTFKKESSAAHANQRANTRLMKLRQPFILTPKKLIETWEVSRPDLLTKIHFEILLDLKPEVIILGTGKKIYFPDVKEYLFLQQQGIGVETMDTAAACRTYNFLVSDGRDVAALLYT